MLETDRLKLVPLSYEQVEKFRHLDYVLEDELGLKRAVRELTDKYKDALKKYTLEWIENDPENFLFATIWLIIDRSENSIAGDIGFKRKADDNGLIEIGYSVQPRFRRRGYATEAIGMISKWAFKHREVQAIIAETLKTNEASIKALKKNGFSKLNYSGKYDELPENDREHHKDMEWHILFKYA